MKKLLILFASFFYLVGPIEGQEKLKAGKVYNPGDSVLAPFVGFEFIVPPDWLGMLPNNTELFLFSYKGMGTHKIYTFSNQSTMKQMIRNWGTGLQLSESLTVTVKGDPEIDGNSISGDLIVKEEDVVIGRAMGLLGDYGQNVVFLAVSNDGNVTPCIEALQYIKTNHQFIDSRNYDQYADIVWAEAFKKKFIYQYESRDFYFENFELWLCANGTFTTKFKVKGAMKRYSDKQYKGKNKGTWTASGTGREGELVLNFNKLEPLRFKVHIENDHIFFDTYRVFASHYECGSK